MPSRAPDKLIVDSLDGLDAVIAELGWRQRSTATAEDDGQTTVIYFEWRKTESPPCCALWSTADAARRGDARHSRESDAQIQAVTIDKGTQLRAVRGGGSFTSIAVFTLIGQTLLLLLGLSKFGAGSAVRAGMIVMYALLFAAVIAEGKRVGGRANRAHAAALGALSKLAN